MKWNTKSRLAFLVLVSLGLGFCSFAAAENTGNGYVRLVLSPKAIVYAQFQNDELRMATSADGLAGAAVVKAKSMPPPANSGMTDTKQFTDVDLPVDKSELGGADIAKVAFQVNTYKSGLQGTVTYVMTTITMEADGVVDVAAAPDAKKDRWTYQQKGYAQLDSVAAGAKGINVMDISKISLNVVAKPDKAKKTIGVGVNLMAGAVNLSDVQKNGQSVLAEVRVLKGDGQ